MTTPMFGTLFETLEDRAVNHAYAVLKDGLNGLQPTARQRTLLRAVADRRGAARAISVAALATQLRTSAREVKADVRDLRMLFGAQIGSTRSEEGGYYLITTKDELFDTCRPFLRQARSEFEMVRAMCNPHELAELEGQLRLTTQEGVADAA